MKFAFSEQFPPLADDWEGPSVSRLTPGAPHPDPLPRGRGADFLSPLPAGRRSSASLAVVLAAMTTLFSFGVLAFSQVLAVHAFGLTLLLGVAIAFLLAPAALRVRPVRRKQPRARVTG